MCLISHMMPGDTSYLPGRQQHPNLVFLGPNAQEGSALRGAVLAANVAGGRVESKEK